MANSGDADAAYALGVIYENGDGVTKDTLIAIKRYRQAASRGHGAAKKKLQELSESSYLNDDLTEGSPVQFGKYHGIPNPALSDSYEDQDVAGELKSPEISGSYIDGNQNNSASGYRSCLMGMGAISLSFLINQLGDSILEGYENIAIALSVILSIIGGIFGIKDLKTIGKEQLEQGEKQLGKKKFKKFLIIFSMVMCFLGIIMIIFTVLIKQKRIETVKKTCFVNLMIIEGSVEQWQGEKFKSDEDFPTEEGLVPYLLDEVMPKCPGGGDYEINGDGEGKPKCSVHGFRVIKEDDKSDE